MAKRNIWGEKKAAATIDSLMRLGDNVTAVLSPDGDKLLIELDLGAQPSGASSKGKSIIQARTRDGRGFPWIDLGVGGYSLYVMATREARTPAETAAMEQAAKKSAVAKAKAGGLSAADFA